MEEQETKSRVLFIIAQMSEKRKENKKQHNNKLISTLLRYLLVAVKTSTENIVRSNPNLCFVCLVSFPSEQVCKTKDIKF